MALTFAGHLSDGRTAARRSVSLRITATGLIIEFDDVVEGGERAMTWAYDDLRLVDEIRRRRPVRLYNVAQSDARLTVADGDILKPLLAQAPHLGEGGLMGRRPGLRLLQWAAGVAVVITILFVGLPRAAEPVAALMPLSWEETLGRQVMSGFSNKYKFCSNPDGVKALVGLVIRLSSVVQSRYKFRVTVADTDVVNAFATPGGYLVLNKGLILAAKSPDDVAGILAHEMGHVIERHATEGIVRAAGLALLAQILIGDASGLIGAGAATGELLLSLAYNRDDEAEADKIAVEILAATGIDSDGFAQFLENMAASADSSGGDGDNTQPAFLSTHPQSADRAAVVRATGAPGGPAMSPAEWQSLRAICP